MFSSFETEILKLGRYYSFARSEKIGCVENKPVYALQIGSSSNSVLYAGEIESSSHILLEFARIISHRAENMLDISGINIHRMIAKNGIMIVPAYDNDSLTNFCSRRKFRHVITFFGQDGKIHYDYYENTPAQSLLMAKILSALSHYEIAVYHQLSKCEFKDYFISHFGKPAFNIGINTALDNDLLEMMTVGIIM